MSAPIRIVADVAHATTPVSPTLFGLFYEDLNRAMDGGLNANMVANHSFDDVYLNRRLHNELIAMSVKRRPRRVRDPLRHWRTTRGTAHPETADALRTGGTYARVTLAGGSAVLENDGYQPSEGGPFAAITARADIDTLFSAWVRTPDLTGRIVVALVDSAGAVITETDIDVSGADRWHRVDAVLPASRDARVLLRLTVEGADTLDLDDVSLVHADHWGAGDPRWSQGRLRRDLVEALRDLHPTFLRFPGGCVVEGIGDGTAYDWKRTVGPLPLRVPEVNLWALRTPDGDYSQSNQIGFYEYFLLCEDLGIAAMPVISAGISCQFRSKQSLPTDGDEFAALRQDLRDLVEWATGDPATSSWAALRAEAGHPEPFAVPYIGLGNENHGSDYLDKFAILRADVADLLPDTRVVLSAGPFARGAAFDQAWAYAAAQDENLIVDEHFYKKPEWFLENVGRYDDYPRGGATVFAGEYAAHPPTSGIGKPKDSHPNTFRSAIAEAAFLTGIVRNSDVVEMTSYAPLLNRVGTRNWDHNLIDFSPDRVMPTANYEVQRLFASHLGNRIVSLHLPEGADGLHASATLAEGELYVILVNSGNEPAAVDLCVDGADIAAAHAEGLHAGSDDTNRLEFEGAPHVAVAVRGREVDVQRNLVGVELPAGSIHAVTLSLNSANHSRQ